MPYYGYDRTKAGFHIASETKTGFNLPPAKYYNVIKWDNDTQGATPHHTFEWFSYDTIPITYFDPLIMAVDNPSNEDWLCIGQTTVYQDRLNSDQRTHRYCDYEGDFFGGFRHYESWLGGTGINSVQQPSSMLQIGNYIYSSMVGHIRNYHPTINRVENDSHQPVVETFYEIDNPLGNATTEYGCPTTLFEHNGDIIVCRRGWQAGSNPARDHIIKIDTSGTLLNSMNLGVGNYPTGHLGQTANFDFGHIQGDDLIGRWDDDYFTVDLDAWSFAESSFTQISALGICPDGDLITRAYVKDEGEPDNTKEWKILKVGVEQETDFDGGFYTGNYTWAIDDPLSSDKIKWIGSRCFLLGSKREGSSATWAEIDYTTGSIYHSSKHGSSCSDLCIVDGWIFTVGSVGTYRR